MESDCKPAFSGPELANSVFVDLLRRHVTKFKLTVNGFILISEEVLVVLRLCEGRGAILRNLLPSARSESHV